METIAFPIPPIEPVLSVRGLSVRLPEGGDRRLAVEDVSFDLPPGLTLCVVGESGSGKSIIANTVMGLLPRPHVEPVAGEVIFEGRNLLALSEEEMRTLRGNRIGMVFQEPMTALNPVMRIGEQLAEVIDAHEDVPAGEKRARILAALADVGLPEPRLIIDSYPFRLSGGQRQRVMIACALLLKPRLLIADEPTTALDVTIQDQILRLMWRLQDENDTSILLITHDLAVVAGLCSRVIVMYGGLVMEEAPTASLFAQPMHPYTMGLLASLPSLRAGQADRLDSIPGAPPDMTAPGDGCPFAPRCKYARVRCELARPHYYGARDGRRSMCWLLDAEAPEADSPFGPAWGELRREVVRLDG
jgi:peptide/nickel transport system ATP-binding protein